MSAAPPVTIALLQELVARSSPAPLRVAGGSTKRPAGERDGAQVLDMRGLSGITAYDPAECVVTALAGTPVAHVVSALAAHGQYLPWEPPFAAGGATIGGMVASGLSGPGRYRYGGVRDFVIGARVVDGRGRLIASGGQVVKNAAGFLTHHALVGSAGRLGIIVEVSFKVFPRPEATCTLVTRAASRAEALAVHERLRLANLDLDALDLDGAEGSVHARLAGTKDALAVRAGRALGILDVAADTLTGDDELGHWAALAHRTWPAAGATIKVPTTPSRLAAVFDVLAPLGACRASVGGAVVYLHTREPRETLDRAFQTGGLHGAIVGGAAYGERLGATPAPAFHDRVRQTLDPDARLR